jgi:ATP-dependent helicase HrpA
MQLDTAFAMSDIQQQLGNLIHKGFVTETGWQRLPDLLRYLRAIERRLEKLAIDPNRDRVHAQGAQRGVGVQGTARQDPQIPADPGRGGQYPLDDRGAASLLLRPATGDAIPISDKRVQSAIAQC